MNERAGTERRIAEATSELALAERLANRLSWARLSWFVIAVVALVLVRPDVRWVVAALLPFALLVRLHQRESRRADRARGALAAARGSLARMDRDWPNVPPLQAVSVSDMPNGAAIGDLDLYGALSLFRLLDVSQPGLGAALTLHWLLEDPAPLTTIMARQASVQQLRFDPDFLLECARLCRHGSRPAPKGTTLIAFRGWCEGPGERFSRRLVWAARVLTATFIATIIVLIARPALIQPLASTLMTIIVGQFVVAGLARKYLHDRLRETADLLAELDSVVQVLRLVVATSSVRGRFGEIQQSLIASGASKAVSKLSRLFAWNNAHHSPMLLAMLDGFAAFDAHLAGRIDDWREEFGPRLPEWIDLVAEAEAITALATLAHENPEWVMPRVHDGAAPVVMATGCGHPLIPDTARVANAVSIESASRAIVVSGSNMSGKTTYLRSVGVNALLALAGGPVCATSFTIRRCRVRTTVRVEDDLGAGVSLFLAEVSRIAEIVGDADSGEGAPLLFLFDEILHGTNAQDRREATQLVLKRLLASGASGIITTHDAQIGDLGDAAGGGRVRPAHFTDSVESDGGTVSMTFDYVLRTGPATTTNALRILKALGLE